MPSHHWIKAGLRVFAVAGAVSLLSACSSSFGGGDEPADHNVVVVPPGTAVVCQNGTAPPCN